MKLVFWVLSVFQMISILIFMINKNREWFFCTNMSLQKASIFSEPSLMIVLDNLFVNKPNPLRNILILSLDSQSQIKTLPHYNQHCSQFYNIWWGSLGISLQSCSKKSWIYNFFYLFIYKKIDNFHWINQSLF